VVRAPNPCPSAVFPLQNRNRFLNKQGREEWFTIQLQPHSNRHLIKDVLVDNTSQWKRTILTKLKLRFGKDFSFVYDHDKLVDINLASINYCRTVLGIQTPMILSSTLGVDSKNYQRLADICDKLGATEYISGQGGREY
jgi:hypothetical protein